MGMEKPSVDSLFACWNDLSPAEQWVLVDSGRRPALKNFLCPRSTPSLRLAKSLIPVSDDGRDKKRQWTIVEDVEPTLESAADLCPVLFWKFGRDGRTGRQRFAPEKGNLGLADLKVALADKDKISERLRSYRIFFFGTILLDLRGNFCVACLEWDFEDGCWFVNFLKAREVEGNPMVEDRLASVRRVA